MTLDVKESARSWNRDPRTIKRWFRRDRSLRGLSPEKLQEKLKFKANQSHRENRRPTIDRNIELAVLERIRGAIRRRRKINFVAVEVFRHVRKHLDRHCSFDGLPIPVQEAFDRLFPPVPNHPQTKVDSLTTRQIVWLQAYTLLSTGAVPWDYLEPTSKEIKAMKLLVWPTELVVACKRIRRQWGEFDGILNIDLVYLQPSTRTPCDFRLRPKEEQEQLNQEGDGLRVSLPRVWKRFNGAPRPMTVDSGVARVLNIFPQTARVLRRCVEQRLQIQFGSFSS